MKRNLTNEEIKALRAKHKNDSTLKKLLTYIIIHSKGMFIIACICVLIATMANVMGSMFSQVVVDKYITPLLLTDSPEFNELFKALVQMGIIFLIGVICTLIYNKLMVIISQNCLKEIRDDMFDRMQSLPIRYFDTHTHGDIMSHYTNDTDTLRQFISQAMAQLISCVITVIASFTAMVYYSFTLALVVVIVTVVIVIVTKLISGKSVKYFGSQQISLANITGYIEEMLGGQKVIKVFCHEKKSKEGFDNKNETLFDDSCLANTYSNILMPALGQISNLLMVILAILGGAMILSGSSSVTAGIVVAFLQLSKSFSMPIQQIGQQISLIAMAMAGAKRIFALLDEESETDDGYVTLVRTMYDKETDSLKETNNPAGSWTWKHPHGDNTVSYVPLKGDIRMYDVDFGYTPEKIVLHNVTLYAEPAQKLAFVGATGAGKTTITNLLNRFYDIADGKIRFDGININKIKKADLRRSIGMVLQDTNLFTDTIMENIRYGRLDASDEECIAAAKLANADGFIRRLPNGYNTMLTEAGAGLSQGQRQLLAIARAAVADPPTMILDEATSSIDTRTEKLVQSGMDSLMTGRSTFVIAHRLSTIQNSDVIMVLDHGRIIERGNHESLIAKKGVYYQLYTGAFEME